MPSPKDTTRPPRNKYRLAKKHLESKNPHQWTVGQSVIWSRSTDKKNLRIEHTGIVRKIFYATLTVEFTGPAGKVLKTVRQDSCIPK